MNSTQEFKKGCADKLSNTIFNILPKFMFEMAEIHRTFMKFEFPCDMHIYTF